MQPAPVGPPTPQKKKAVRQPRNRANNANKGARAPRGAGKNVKAQQNASRVPFSLEGAEGSVRPLTVQQQRYAVQQQMKMANQHSQQYAAANRYQVILFLLNIL